MLPIDRIKDETFTDNLAKILDMPLPKPPNKQKNDNQIECGVCYAQYLPIGMAVFFQPISNSLCTKTYHWYDAFYIDDELGANSGSGTDYTCENSNCSRAFHSVCLGDWLCSITTTRQYVPWFWFLWICLPKSLLYITIASLLQVHFNLIDFHAWQL